MKVLFVVNAHEFTAGHRLPILRGARERGHAVEAVAPTGSPAFERLHAAGFAVHGVPLSRRGVRVWEEVAAIRALARLYGRLRPDLVHHTTIKPVIYGSLAARRARLPAVVNAITGLGYVYTDGSFRARLLRTIVAPLYRRAFHHPNQRVIFQNNDDRAVLERASVVRRTESVLIPGSGVDVARFTPEPEPDGVPIVVLAGRMLWSKGVGEFVAMARSLRAKGVRARFRLVGGEDPGNPAAIPRTRLDEWVAEGVIEWHGQESYMRRVYQESTIVCLPSYREGLPKVLLEAAACGRPVVTTDAPGCRDAVADGVTGYVVPPNHADALAQRVEELLASPGLRRTMGLAGRERAVREFAVERVVDRTLAVYEELLAPHRYAAPRPATEQEHTKPESD